ncbi:hypothetical protein EYF80_049905 [Liparis tanakae]|uniref:Uncharacterized protein n=1 Tax=Liparis tanakae TaxID=230148 RepID=A0A4Z2FF97_9TELE|nr:hypothetical protein EYF80_049905 [Liparis tanakae]
MEPIRLWKPLMTSSMLPITMPFLEYWRNISNGRSVRKDEDKDIQQMNQKISTRLLNTSGFSCPMRLPASRPEPPMAAAAVAAAFWDSGVTREGEEWASACGSADEPSALHLADAAGPLTVPILPAREEEAELFDREASALGLGVCAGVGGGVMRLDVVTGGGGEAAAGGGGAGIKRSIFSHSARTWPRTGTGDTKGTT